MEKFSSKRWFSSKLLLIGGLIFLFFVGLNFTRSWYKNREINQEITGLRQEIKKIEKDNLQLSELIKYLNSTAYLEEKARIDLGLKKEGENTIIIPDLTNDLIPPPELESADDAGLISNPQKWWRYFFAKK